MDQFSHDLTVALEETSLLDRARCWTGQRRRTRSTGNLPCAPQPTEDSSSSPTDTATQTAHACTNVDGLVDTNNVSNLLSVDEDDDEEDVAPRLPNASASLNAAAVRLGTLESDSLNETFSPARFFKSSGRKKRKLKRMAVEYETSNTASAQQNDSIQLSPGGGGSGCGGGGSGNGVCVGGGNGGVSCSNSVMRKRILKPTDGSNHRLNLFFCGKRKRSNRDRYHTGGADGGKMHSTSVPRHTYIEEYRMRPRSFSSTSKPHSDRLLPLNKGLLSKIERISNQQQHQKTDPIAIDLEATINSDSRAHDITDTDDHAALIIGNGGGGVAGVDAMLETTFSTARKSSPLTSKASTSTYITSTIATIPPQGIPTYISSEIDHIAIEPGAFQSHRKKANNTSACSHSRRRTQMQQLQFAVEQHPMDCADLNDFLSSSSLSSSESDDVHAANDTDREGDDELTDWPGNEGVGGPSDGSKYDPKRKLTKKSTNLLLQSTVNRMDDSANILAEDDTLMSGSGEWSTPFEAHETFEITARYQPSQPIAIAGKSFGLSGSSGGGVGIGVGGGIGGGGTDVGSGGGTCGGINDDMNIPIKQIESEMSGETSNPFLSSPPFVTTEVREIRAGCRRIKERAGFSIKTSVNERLARFLQDPRQIQIRLPDVEIYEQESLVNLATLYSLQMSLDNGCAVLTKTSNTTQSTINIDQQNLQSRFLLSDFKRRCYDNKNTFIPHK